MMCPAPQPDPPTPSARYVQPGDLRYRTERPRRHQAPVTPSDVTTADDADNGDLSPFSLLELTGRDLFDLLVALLILAAIIAILVMNGGPNV